MLGKVLFADAFDSHCTVRLFRGLALESEETVKGLVCLLLIKSLVNITLAIIDDKRPNRPLVRLSADLVEDFTTARGSVV